MKSFALILIGLAACSRGNEDPNLLNIKQPRAEGPDEFAVLPTKPLQMPQDGDPGFQPCQFLQASGDEGGSLGFGHERAAPAQARKPSRNSSGICSIL